MIMKNRVVSRLAALLVASAASCALADSYYWTGSVSAQWTDPGNWMNQSQGGIPGVPGPGDSANLAYASVQLNGNAAVGTVFGNGTVSVNGSLTGDAASGCSIILTAGQLDIPSMSSVNLTLNGGDVAGQPELASCVVSLGSSGQLNLLLTGSNTLYGNVRAGQRLTSRAIGTSNALLYFPSPLINSGTIVMEGDATCESRLRCDYTITNNGEIAFEAQAGVLQSSLENNGQLNISGATTFLSYGAVYRNLGVFSIAAGGGLQASGNAQTFVQEAGSFAGAQRATFFGMNVRYSGGEFLLEDGESTGPVLYSCVLENYATGAVRYDAYATTTMYGHVHSGQAVFSRNWSGEGSSLLYFPSPISNAGLIVVDSQLQATSGTLRTDYTMTNSGIILLAGQGTRLFMGSLSNTGTFTIDAPSTFSLYGAQYLNMGELMLNQPLSISGQAQTFRQISGHVRNAHRLTMQSMSVAFEGGSFDAGPGETLAPVIHDCAFTNASSLPLALDARGTTTFYGNIAAGQTIVSSHTPGGSNPYLYFPGPISNAGEIIITSESERSATLRTDYTLTNTGIVRIQPGGGGSRLFIGSLVNEGQYFVETPTVFSNYGAVYLNRGLMRISPSSALAISGAAQTFTQESGTLENSSLIGLNAMTFVYSGGTISPEASLPSGPKLTDCVLSLAATGPIDLECSRTTTVYGHIADGQTLRFLNTSGADAAYAYFPSPVTNAGRISVSSRTAAAPATLRTDYTLTNAATGIVEFLPGTGGDRTFYGSLLNQGHWSVQAPTTATLYGAVFANYGLFEVVSPATFLIGGQPQTFTQYTPGIMTGGRNIKGRPSASFQYFGGQVAGPGPELTDCVVNFAAEATEPIDLLLHGTTTFYGMPLPGHKINSVAMPGAGAFLYFPGPITNQGEITLSTQDPDQPSRMRTDYTFINSGSLHLDPGGRVEGNSFIQTAPGTTHFVLKGIEPNEFGRIAVTGTASLDGTVTNQTEPGYTTYDQDHWDVISAPGGLSGTYATEALNPGFSFRYEGQLGRLVFLRCAADYNLDGGVDGSDVDAFFFDWERGFLSADVNVDGGVDGSDVTFFFEAWEAGGCP
jgi:hypothetical protein